MGDERVTFAGLAAALFARTAPTVPAELELIEEPDGFLQARRDDDRWEAFPVDEPELEEEIDPSACDPPFPAFAVLPLWSR